MKINKDFEFIDNSGLHWYVPEGTIVNGASIPRVLWSLIGGPFEGKYRKASVVHDYYCDIKLISWREVHRMFYDACLVEGLDDITAKMMYAAVYAGGPRWPQLGYSSELPTAGWEDDDEQPKVNKNYINDQINWVKENNPSLKEIEEKMDKELDDLKKPTRRDIRRSNRHARKMNKRNGWDTSRDGWEKRK